MTEEAKTIDEKVAALEAAVGQFDAKLAGILDKFVPVSEQRIEKHWTATRDTMAEYMNQLAALQLERNAQNDKITSLANQVAAYHQQAIAMALQQGGAPVPKEGANGAAD